MKGGGGGGVAIGQSSVGLIHRGFWSLNSSTELPTLREKDGAFGSSVSVSYQLSR